MPLPPLPLLTPRLELRLAAVPDAAAITRYVNENRDFLAPWEPERTSYYYSELFWRAQVIRDRRSAEEERALRLWLFAHPEAVANFPSGEVVGAINIANIVRGAGHFATLGYALAEKSQGAGLMREALEAVIACAWGPMGLHRLQANYLPRNERSGGLLRRLGFAPEGYARDYLLINGKWEDHILTSLTNPGWSDKGG